MNPSQTLQQTDYYTVLGADPMAQLDQIEALFRELAIEAETTGDHSKVPQAVEAFKVLRDPQLRQQYDQVLNQQRSQLPQHQMMPLAEAQPQPVQQPQAMEQAEPSAFPQDATQQSLRQAAPTLVDQIPQPQVVQPQVLPEQPMQAVSDSSELSGVSSTQVSASPMTTAIQEPVVEAASEPAVTEIPAEPEVETTEPASPEPTPENKSTPTEELRLKPDVLERHRRELMRRFYEKRRANMRAAGIAIGGLDTVVEYSYELLEFHLWVLAEKKWIVREESGALAISALGCENHEKNLTDGLIVSSLE